jgi:rare lipoprotein A
MRGDISAMHKRYYILAHSSSIALPCALLVFTLAGCHHQAQTAYQPPPPPPLHHSTPPPPEITQAPRQPIEGPRSKPTLIETGLASWYGPNYHHKAAADGSVFDQNEMTAAHRTLPLGTTVRVTNLATGEQVVVRITDRGPFAPGRVLDLSMGAAKAVGIYRAGVAKVRVEAFANPTADPTGKWAVQTGAFTTEQDALDLKDALIKRYRTARVSEFHGPTGYWVRIDPADHARPQAEAMLNWIGKPDPQALPYLVRID